MNNDIDYDQYIKDVKIYQNYNNLKKKHKKIIVVALCIIFVKTLMTVMWGSNFWLDFSCFAPAWFAIWISVNEIKRLNVRSVRSVRAEH